jgi:hypothetical protein
MSRSCHNFAMTQYRQTRPSPVGSIPGSLAGSFRQPWRPLPAPESGSPARGIGVALLLSLGFWLALASIL